MKKSVVVLGNDNYCDCDFYFWIQNEPFATTALAQSVRAFATLNAQWQWEPSIGQNLQSFMGNCDVSIRVKNSRVAQKKKNIKLICFTFLEN